MNLTWIWRACVSAALALFIGLMGWTLSSVAEMPKEYTTKEELKELRKENRDDHKEILREIRRLHTES
jgi:hypothetical protein